MNKTIKALASYAANSKAPEGYSLEDVNTALIGELNKLINGNINNYNKYKHDIFEIIIENADVVVPKRLTDLVSTFAEIKQVGQGQKAVFKLNPKSANRNRARKFITQVGLSGYYETFRTDNRSVEINAGAIGGAITVDFERVLDGTESLSDMMDLIAEGLADAMSLEVQKALRSAVDYAEVPANNRVIHAGFDAIQMQSLVNTVKVYGGAGSGAVIFAAPEFVGAMGPDAIVPGTTQGAQGIYHPDDIDSIHKTGYIQLFRGVPVVEIPQSFVDENNDKVWIDPQLAYVLPTGGEKIVKIVLEGATQVWDNINRDQSIEINCYKKMGVGILTHHNWGIYKNTEIEDSMFYEG